MNKEQLTTRLTELTDKLNDLALQIYKVRDVALQLYKVREEVKALTNEISVTPAPATRRDCAVPHRDRAATRRDCAVDQTDRPFTIRFVYKGEFRD